MPFDKKLLNQSRTEEFVRHLIRSSGIPGPRANLTLSKEVADTFAELCAEDRPGFEALLNFARPLATHKHEYVRMVIANSLGAIALQHHEEVLPLLRELANDPSWRVREGAAEGIGRLLSADFEHIFPLLADWINSGEPNLQRAVAVGALSIVSYDKDVLNEHAQEILYALKLLMSVNDLYVKKGMQFTINVIGSKLPDLVTNTLCQWLLDEPAMRHSSATQWIINESLSKSFGKKNPQQATRLRRALHGGGAEESSALQGGVGKKHRAESGLAEAGLFKTTKRRRKNAPSEEEANEKAAAKPGDIPRGT